MTADGDDACSLVTASVTGSHIDTIVSLSDDCDHCTPCKILSNSLLQRRSPRVPKPSKRYSLQQTLGENVDGIKHWQLSMVMQIDSCSDNCIRKLHGLTEFEVLFAHSRFDATSNQEQNKWILEYLITHCPIDSSGYKGPKLVPFFVTGKSVCLNVWLAVLPVSLSCFYRLRQDFLTYDLSIISDDKRSRSLSSKSMEAVAWMENYFDRIGDKRPDKDRIYLPTCLTKRKIFEIMTEELYQGNEEKAIYFSQFNKLFKMDFRRVYKCVLFDLEVN